ncbi:MAG: hypothetical protein CMH82_08205 [Nocardioides sp.]|nr:hypothetical protein [Nocardioides sp.]
MRVTRPLYLHIGLQKTGTSYLQGLFLGNVDALRGAGLDVYPTQRRAAYWLMLDVRDRFRPHDPAQAREVLRDLPGNLDAAQGRAALVSEESFSPAEDAQIQRLLAACSDREVHVVVTARDLGRQIPSVWQQGLQSGRAMTFPDYLARLHKTQGTPAPIWWQKDLPAVLEKWARHVPAERIHVVTVPPPGADKGLLLERFCSVLGIDAGLLDQSSVGRANRGLRLEQAEVLRRVNAGIPDDLKRRDVYGDVGKRGFSVKVLGGAEGRPILLPESERAWCEELSHRYVEHVRAGGYDVVGDVEDLLPRDSAFAPDEQEVTEEQVAQVAVDALTTMVSRQLATHRRRKDRAAAEAAERAGRGWRGRLRRMLRV